MTNKNYFEQVKADVNEYMEDNEYYFNLSDYADVDDFQERIYESMFVADSVTGNGSGSYTFNREEAKEYVLADIDTVKEALSEFCVSAEEVGNKFLEEDWEYLDVTARCYILWQAVGAWIDENREALEGAIEEAHREAEEA